MEGERLCIFSYGSGLQASMYSIKIRSDASVSLSHLLIGVSNVRRLLDLRTKIDPESYAQMMCIREAYHQSGNQISKCSRRFKLN